MDTQFTIVFANPFKEESSTLPALNYKQFLSDSTFVIIIIIIIIIIITLLLCQMAVAEGKSPSTNRGHLTKTELKSFA